MKFERFPNVLQNNLCIIFLEHDYPCFTKCCCLIFFPIHLVTKFSTFSHGFSLSLADDLKSLPQVIFFLPIVENRPEGDQLPINLVTYFNLLFFAINQYKERKRTVKYSFLIFPFHKFVLLYFFG